MKNIIQFIDTSTGNPNEWYWDFGDGTHSYEQNPVHRYTDIGSYIVTLYSSNQYQYDVYTTTIIVTSITYEHAPLVNFKPAYLNVITSNPYTTVDFTNLTFPTDSTFVWDFGDSSTSYNANPSHEYNLGIYDVTLTAINNYGSSSITYYNCIRIHNKGRTFYEHVGASDEDVDAFECKVFYEMASTSDELIPAKVFDESCEIVQREIPDKPGIDEFGIYNFYSSFNEFGHAIKTRLNEWGHRIIHAATANDRRGLSQFEIKRFDETIVVSDSYTVEEDYPT